MSMPLQGESPIQQNVHKMNALLSPDPWPSANGDMRVCPLCQCVVSGDEGQRLHADYEKMSSFRL